MPRDSRLGDPTPVIFVATGGELHGCSAGNTGRHAHDDRVFEYVDEAVRVVSMHGVGAARRVLESP